MSRLPIVVVALLAVPAALAQGNPDRMQTPQCATAREQASLDCFGLKPSPPTEGRFVPPPVAVTPIPAPPSPAVPPVAAIPQPPLAIPRPPVVTACDASGCWDSNGTRYNQQGPVLLGPKGVCTLQAGALNCP
jgi:hypothetical protein